MKEFMARAPSSAEAAHAPTQLPKSLEDAINWCCERTEAQVIAGRELALNQLEQLILRDTDENAAWLASADSRVKTLSKSIAGYTLQTLAENTSFHDPAAVELLRSDSVRQTAKAKRITTPAL